MEATELEAAPEVIFDGADTERAPAWSERVGIDFHEVRVETNAQRLTIVFADLKVDDVG
jgi:hypothetical protein